MEQKKTLIISMVAGFGHLKAGEALLDYAKESLPQLDVLHVDISQIDPAFKRYAKIYDFFAKKFPWFWGLMYRTLNIRIISSFVKHTNIFSYIMSPHVARYIKKTNPGSILFTNVVPLPLFTFAFRRKFPRIKIGIVVTDYHGHAYYHFASIDYYFVGNQTVAEDLIRAGVDSDKIFITGIPVSPAFFVKQDVVELKKKYGLKNNLPVALLVASFKTSERELVSLIAKMYARYPEVNLIVLVNNNQAFYQAIEKSFPGKENLFLVKWTDTMAEYMKIADVVIAKAGGLTTSECMTLRKPMIMFRPTPGQEEYNAEFIEKNNFGRRARSIDDIVNLLSEIIFMSKRQKADAKEPVNPSKEIFEKIV